MPTSRPKDWTKAREAQHEARFPPKLKAERNRLAQQRYRQRHAERLRRARRVAALLLRQNWYRHDYEEFAALLVAIVGRPVVRSLRRHLTR